MGYREIVEEFRTRILTGQILPGSRLPSVRELARTEGVTSTTAQRAYNELRRQGLLVSRAGSGTRVARLVNREVGAEFLGRIPQVGPIANYEEMSDSIGFRSLATAVPDPDLFNADDFLAEMGDLRRASSWTWYYGASEGVPELLAEIQRLLARRGIRSRETELLVTNGSMHALSLVLSELTRPGDTVLLEQPTFLLANELLESLGLVGAGIRSGTNGIEPDELLKLAGQNPKAPIILFPTFHSATGRNQLERMQILQIAERYGLRVIEVDRYRDIPFEPPPPPLVQHCEAVIYVDSFTYNLAPGLRMGYIRAPATLASRLIRRSTSMTLAPSPVLQIPLARYLAKGHLEAHLKRVVPEYRRRRDALLRSLQLRMPRGTTWTTPLGGFALWTQLPPGRYDDLYSAALTKGLAFTPSDVLLMTPDPTQLRLAFGCQEPEAIEAAIAILGELVEKRAL